MESHAWLVSSRQRRAGKIEAGRVELTTATQRTFSARPNSRLAARPVRIESRITGIGTAVSAQSYSQQELVDLFGITDPGVCSIFANSAIRQRHLSLPPLDRDGRLAPETHGELLEKHKRLAVGMGARALQACLESAGASIPDVAHLCCVTSTGFLTPGLSALLIRDQGISPECSRVDVVGMGCNAGLNALSTTAGWAAAHPGQLAIMLCAEACSAAYVIDETMRSAVVNSLFGDGAAAVAVVADANANGRQVIGATGPRMVSFTSQIITDALDAMRFDWDDAQGKFSFYIDRDVPYVVGAHAELVIDRLLSGVGMRRSDVRHWVVHAGGKKVIDAVMINLGLSRYDLRHTISVLRDYGNLSSASFLFSYERLLRQELTSPGDYGVMMTMGPGSSIESALIQW